MTRRPDPHEHPGQAGQAGRPGVNLSRRRLVSMALMTVVGVTIVLVAFVTTEPNWLMWLFGSLMLLSALAFWTTYAFYRRSRR